MAAKKKPDVTLDDLRPFADMIDTWTQTIDDLTPEEAIDAIVAVDGMSSRLRDAKIMLVAQAMTGLEHGEITRNGKRYRRVPKFKTRTNHARVRSIVLERALVDGNGRKVTAKGAAFAVERAIKTVFDLYLSDSSTAKTGVLKQLEIEPESVNGREHTGWEIGEEDA